MEILLVEDSLPAARLTMGALKNGGIEHRLTWIADGNEASSFLQQEGRYSRAPRPDLQNREVTRISRPDPSHANATSG